MIGFVQFLNLVFETRRNKMTRFVVVWFTVSLQVQSLRCTWLWRIDGWLMSEIKDITKKPDV